MISKIPKSIKNLKTFRSYKVRQNGVEFYLKQEINREQWNINNEVNISEVQIFEKLKIENKMYITNVQYQ